MANNTNPPAPYDPETVQSVVRWGTLSGNLTNEEQQNHRLVYAYVYGPETGNTTYQSPILHHVLLSDLEPDTTHYYSVGEPTALPYRMPFAAVCNCILPSATHRR